MRKLMFLLFLIPFMNADSQDIPVRRLPTEVLRSVKKDANDTTQWRWKRRGAYNLNFSQGTQSNWAAGGDNFSMAINTYFNYQVFYRKNKHSWDNNLDFYFGFIKATSLGSRKNDDRIDILSKYGYNFDKRWYATSLFNFRSQFFDGYTYSGKVENFSSTFMTPAYIILSLGADYKPNNNFSMFLSPVTSRWVVIASDKIAAKGLYGVPINSHALNELGAFASINYTKPLMKNVSYKGRADLFSNYKYKAENVDMYVTNSLAFRINKYLSASYNLDVIYDDDVKLFGDTHDSPALQIKSLIGIGFSMRFAEIANP